MKDIQTENRHNCKIEFDTKSILNYLIQDFFTSSSSLYRELTENK